MESIPIAILGGATGILLATGGLRLLGTLIPYDLPRLGPISVNTNVLAFTATIPMLTTVFFILVPAIRSAKTTIRQDLEEGSRVDAGPGPRRLQGALVIAEVSLALLLLTGAALLIRTLVSIQRVDTGFSPDHLLTMLIPLSPTEFPYPHQDGAVQMYQELVTRLDALPGVKDAALTTTLPLGVGSDMDKWIDIVGHAPPASLDKVPLVQFQLSSPRFLPTIGARLRQGRFFTDQDNQTASAVAIINETFARQFFPNENPIGKSIRTLPPVNLLPPDIASSNQQAPFRTVVGVIGDMKDGLWIDHSVLPTVYAPYFQYLNEAGLRVMIMVVRTSGDPNALSADIRSQIRSLRPNQSIADVATMEEHLQRSLSPERFTMLLFSIFAGLALLLSAIGIYGVMAYSVVQRTCEIGVRVALGAERAAILGLVVTQGAKLALIGVAIGLFAALGLTRLLRGLLYGVSATDPVTFAGVAMLLMTVALIACYIPARRAMRVDPAVALRHE
jgi:putative ABC transport system permease protein